MCSHMHAITYSTSKIRISMHCTLHYHKHTHTHTGRQIRSKTRRVLPPTQKLMRNFQ